MIKATCPQCEYDNVRGAVHGDSISFSCPKCGAVFTVPAGKDRKPLTMQHTAEVFDGMTTEVSEFIDTAYRELYERGCGDCTTDDIDLTGEDD